MPGQAKLFSLFNPKSIAVVGASEDPKKVGSICLRNIIESGFTGNVYCVNPKHSKIADIKCFKSVADLPEKPELVVIATPAHAALELLIQCGELGLKNSIVFSAGFKEAGSEGEELEKKLQEIIKIYGLNILGPNCFGYINTKSKINTTFGKVIKDKGLVKFISQSGAIAASLFDYSNYVGIGFDEFITVGNKSSINENDILEYWLENGLKDNYSPIGIYLESISNGEKFLELAKKITSVSPIFILKPGKSLAARHAMQSHTGSLAGEDNIFEEAMRSAGIIRCYAIEDVFDLTKAFSWQLFPSSNKVAVVSNAGGPAVISADVVEEYGLQLAKIGNDERKFLFDHLPHAASIVDPIDILGDALADRYETALTEVLTQKDIGSVVVLLTPQVMTQIEETAKTISRLKEKYNKPVICAFIGGGDITLGKEILNKHKVPCYSYPERAIRVLGQIWKWKKWQKDSIAQRGILVKDLKSKAMQEIAKFSYKGLSSDDVNTILKDAGIIVPFSTIIDTDEEVDNIAGKMDFPVVAKVCLPGLVHKTKGGGVSLDIANTAELKREFRRLKNLDERAKIFVQKQVQPGVEIIIGVRKDPTFGYAFLFGAGGVNAEIIRDNSISLFSDTYPSMLKNIGSTVAFKISREQKLILDVVDRFIEMINTNPIFFEIEINPLIVNNDGVWAVDGKAILL